MKKDTAKTTTSYSTHLLRHWRFAIGQNIHHHRSQQKLPLKKLARLTGISEPLLDQYELGKNEIRLDALLKIACALRVPVTELMQA
jgi:transcriptional regulator with XRE-family HTH domain